MGILGSLLGNASEVDVQSIEKEFERILAPDETMERAYKLIRDLFVFTDKRLIMVDKQGMTGKKTAFHSIPYKSVTHFSVETAGHFDLDAELKIWVSGSHEPIAKEFKKDKNIYDVQRTLATFILK